MMFELKKMTIEDRQKVLNDINSDHKHYRSIIHLGFKDSDSDWVVDKVKGYYKIYTFDSHLPGNSQDRRSIFFYQGRAYEVSRLGFVGPFIRIIDTPSDDIIADFKAELSAAFFAEDPEQFISPESVIFKTDKNLA